MVFKSLEQKFDVRTHHNALRLSSENHQTMGLAQARPNKNKQDNDLKTEKLLPNFTAIFSVKNINFI